MLFAMGSIGTSQPSNSTFLYMDPNTGNSTGRFYCLFRQLFSCVTNRVRLSSLVIVWKTLTIIVIQKNCLVACCDPGILMLSVIGSIGTKKFPCSILKSLSCPIAHSTWIPTLAMARVDFTAFFSRQLFPWVTKRDFTLGKRQLENLLIKTVLAVFSVKAVYVTFVSISVANIKASRKETKYHGNCSLCKHICKIEFKWWLYVSPWLAAWLNH